MQKPFDTLIDSFIKNKVGIAENFLSAALCAQLQNNIALLLAQQLLLPAGTGNALLPVHNIAMRGDMIYWLGRQHNNPYENAFLNLVDDFIGYLNATCYTGITGYEFHYAVYPGGTSYKKHLDQFKSNKGRQFTMIMYLNSNWQQADGGELCIHQNGQQQNIAPMNGTGIFFKSSELEHEVLLSHKPRMSITGWLKV